MITCCKNCGRHLGWFIDADAQCKCEHVSIIRNGELKKIVLRELYTPRKITATDQSSS